LSLSTPRIPSAHAGATGARLTIGRARAAAAAALLVAIVLAAHASRSLSPPADEFGRIVTGLAYLRVHDYRMDFATPPLAKYLVAAPLVAKDVNLALDDPTWHAVQDREWMDVVAYEAGNDPLEILRLGRAPMLLFLAGLGALVFTWTRRLYGPSAAVLATAVFALTPNTLAYAWFANMDFALGLMLPLAVFTLWRFLERPTRARLVTCGLVLGATLTTHFASISLAAIFPLLIVLGAFHKRSYAAEPQGSSPSGPRAVFPRLAARKWPYLALCFCTMGLIALGVVWAVYGFDTQPILRNAPNLPDKLAWIESHVPGSPEFRARVAHAAAEAPLPGATFARGILNVLRRTGEAGTQGYWWFYLVVFFSKVPLPFLLLAGWALLRRPRRPSYDEWFLLLPAAIFFFLASRSVYQSGLRNIYPVIPLLAIYSGRVLSGRFQGAEKAASLRRGARIFAAAIPVWLGLISINVHPHHLSYYNALVGGPGGGIWASQGSADLDWGQGLVGLREEMARLGIEEVFLASPTRTRPSMYGISAKRAAFGDFHRPEELEPGVYAISTTYVRRFDWLREREPLARVGNVLWLYRIGAPSDRSTPSRSTR
jgi:hypothetical protein